MFDKKKIEEGIRLLLEGIGENPDREGLKDTPDRVARMYEELCSGMNRSPKEHLSKTFTCDNENVVIEKDITFIQHVNIILCHFMERCILRTFQMARLWESVNLQEQ